MNKINKDQINKIREGLKFPYVNLSCGALGGDDLYILVSFDKKEDWVNGNSNLNALIEEVTQ